MPCSCLIWLFPLLTLLFLYLLLFPSPFPSFPIPAGMSWALREGKTTLSLAVGLLTDPCSPLMIFQIIALN